MMLKLLSKPRELKLKPLIIHLVLWALVLLFFTQFLKFQTEDFNKIINFSLLLMPVTIGTTYTTIYYLIPKHLLTKQYFLFFLHGIYVVIISAYLITLSIYGGLFFFYHLTADEMLPISKSLILVFVGVYTIVFVASVFSLERQNQNTITKNQDLKNQLLERELKLNAQKLDYLKMQIHPHFLFNTLNTIYGFSLQKSDHAPDMILKLSNLLDYLLYQVNDSSVELKQEVEHIQDYIALEQLRFQDVLKVNFKIGGEGQSVRIAPMLMLPFVENAFKHGNIRNGFLEIKINLELKKEVLCFSIYNSIDKNLDRNNKAGIGLKNIKSRLALLYKDNYDLKIATDDDFFRVDLFLNIPKITNECALK
jgi:two-component system LytT family sensor kinase